MAEDTAAPPSSPPQKDPILIHTRQEPFEHGLLPIPKLVFSDGTLTLASVKDKLLHHSSSSAVANAVDSSPPQHRRVYSVAIVDALQISDNLARLIIDTIAAVLPSDSDPLVAAKPGDVDAVGVNVFDLIMFLYIQNYKRLLPRTHKDSAAVADVWPSTVS